MFKKILAIVAMLYAAAAFAAVDVNKATAAELDAVKGIGPAISTKILDERKKGNFKDWNDFIERVKGVGEGNAAKFSAEGMTVNGSGFKGVAAAPAAKKDDKPAAKTEAKADAKADAKAAPAKTDAKAAAPVATPDVKKEVKAANDKDMKAVAKDDKKMSKEDKKAAKEEKKAAKAAAKDDAKDAKADAAKPAASAAKK